MIERPLRRLRHALEALGAILWFALMRPLPFDWASSIGGAIGRTIGPRLPISERARRNLRLAMPELDGPEVERIVCGMWENFGRVIAEYPHLGRHALWAESGRIDIVGREHIGQAVGSDTARIFFSGHLANWELMPIAAAQSDVPLRLIYRAPNNPWIDGLIGRLRSRYHRGLIPKGAAGARQAVGTLKAKENLGLVVDQKMNDGIAVPFFGRPAMTAPALIDLARRYDAAVYPVRIERRNGARFRVTVMPPVPVPNTADRHADLVAGMTDVNRILEGWIRAAPEQWLWLHRRWPES